MARVQWMLGLGLTALFAWLVSLGGLDRLEFATQDLRHKTFHRSNPAPSPDVALVLIDDGAIETYGRWPWNRSLLATAIDQLRVGGASVIASDLLLTEPQSLELLHGPDGTTFEIDHDAILAEAVRKHGRCVLATSFNFRSDQSRRRVLVRSDGSLRLTFMAVYDAIRANPEIAISEIWTVALDSVKAAEVAYPAEMSETEAMAHISGFQIKQGPALDDTRRLATIARSLLASEPHSSVTAPADSRIWAPSNDPATPIAPLAATGARLATVSFSGGDADESVRGIPLWTRIGDRLYPTLGLAAAAMHLHAPIGAIRPALRETRVPLSNGDVVAAPMSRRPLKDLSSVGPIDGTLYVTWPVGGFSGWQSQFPGRSGAAQLIPIGRLLDPILVILPNIRANITELDQWMLQLEQAQLVLINAREHGPRSDRLLSMSPDDPAFGPSFYEHVAAWKRAVAEAANMLEALKGQGIPEDQLTVDERAQIDLIQQVASRAPSQIGEIEQGVARYLEAQTIRIPELVGGKICFIGYSYTGATADFVPTSIDGKTPGVLIHAAVANSILTSQLEPNFLRPAPLWMSVAATAILGALGAFVAVRTAVLLSPLLLILLMIGWIAFDGIVLWDRGNLVVAQAGPLGAAFFSWLLVTLHRLLIEQRGRKRTEERFRAYVPPDVVDILVNNPALSSMAPQKRELTMFFSDIEGFTTLSERLGTEGISKLLSAYLGAMTQILLSRRATLDKYLGDGIMAFWGAPLDDPDHARNAVAAAVQMIEQLRWMNEAGAFDDAAKGVRLAVRIGLATGEVNVGDFGNPPSKSAYTVIGDAVNLAARLESANKQFGSTILINHRLRELIGDEFPVRLIGRVVVKGKKQFETLYEVVGPGRAPGGRTQEWIETSERVVKAFINKDFDACLSELVRLETEFDDGMLADVYRHAVAIVRMDSSALQDFNGAIVLSEK